MPSEPATELFCGDHHRDVLAVAALAVSAVFGRHAETEDAHLGEARDHILRDVVVVAVHVLGTRCDLSIGERAERVLHHLELAVEMTRAGLIRERCDERGAAIFVEERMCVAQGCLLEAPHRFAPAQPRDQIVHHVGRERARQSCLDIALRAIVQHRPRRSHLGRGMGKIVRKHLMHVRPATGCKVPHRLAHHTLGDVDRVGRGDEIRCREVVQKVAPRVGHRFRGYRC